MWSVAPISFKMISPCSIDRYRFGQFALLQITALRQNAEVIQLPMTLPSLI
jgi:hypothetical protein